MSCGRPTGSSGTCTVCDLPFSRGWFVGLRQGALDHLVSVSKFDSVRAGCDMQAELLDDVLPALPERTVVVPIPTIARHIRQRGYGHAERIAEQLAKRRGAQYSPALKRAVQHVQQGATRAQRKKQAAESYTVDKQLDPETTYLLVDDVYTTGFTMRYASEVLKDAGAQDIWVAVTSRQPLDEQG